MSLADILKMNDEQVASELRAKKQYFEAMANAVINSFDTQAHLFFREIRTSIENRIKAGASSANCSFYVGGLEDAPLKLIGPDPVQNMVYTRLNTKSHDLFWLNSSIPESFSDKNVLKQCLNNFQDWLVTEGLKIETIHKVGRQFGSIIPDHHVIKITVID